MRLLWLYLAATLLVACWSWSFPDELLNPDGGVDLGADAGADGPSKDVTPAEDLPPPDGPTPDTVKPCSPPCDKTSTLPICDDKICRGCRKHSECAGVSDGELCAADGSCPDDSKIYYVSKSCVGAENGSKSDPFCKIPDAVAGSKSFVLVRAGLYKEDLTIDKNAIEIYGEPGATLKMGGCDKLVIKGASKVVLSGLEILGTVNVEGTAIATLLGNTLGPSVCVGVTSTKDTSVILERNLIRGNTAGGLDLDGNIKVVNNIIIKNGALGTTAFGGAKLKPLSAPACDFFNNTLYGNLSKATKTEEAGGVRCETVGIKVINNIFWKNTFNGAASKAEARQYSPNCEPTYNLEQLDASATPVSPNITASDPGLTKTGNTNEADYYHLTPTSPAVDNGDPSMTPTYDFDYELRSDKKPDIGADEHIP